MAEDRTPLETEIRQRIATAPKVLFPFVDPRYRGGEAVTFR